MPIVWTDRFPARERPIGYLRLLLARYRYDTRIALKLRGMRLGAQRVPGYCQQMSSWRNKYKGRPGFVLGNGPSLQQMDLSALKDEITIGCNGIYKNFDEWGWKVDYLLFEDIEQTELRRHDIPGVKGPIKLAGLHNAYAFKADRDTYFMNVRNLDADFLQDQFPQFSEDFAYQVHLASTVTYIGLQLAFHLGCDPVYVIGIDHNYGELPRMFPPCKLTITEENIHLVRGLHMKQDYYKVGDVIGVPSIDYMEEGYKKAREVFEAHGRRVLNAGLDSALEVFDKVDFSSIFSTPDPPSAKAASGNPKILFISHDAGQLGAQVLLLSLIHKFAHRFQWDCRIIIREPNGTLIPQFEAEAETSVFWPDPQKKELGAHQEDLRETVNAWRPDVIYSNTTSNGDIIDFLAPAVPVVVHTHELQWYLSLLDEDRHRTFVEKTDLHIACSNAVKENLIKHHGIDPALIEVVYEAIDFARLQEKVTETSAEEARAQLGIPADAVLVGNCGRIDERKGWDLFIEMAEKVIARKREGTAVHFVWIGHGPNHQDLLSEAGKRGIADCVHAPGPQENPFPFFEAMDIEVMCSRDDPFPLVVMETAYLGCPVIAFKEAGGAPEFIREDCGIVVPEISADALAEAVLTLVNDAELRKRLGENARARAASEFDIRYTSPQVARILHERLGLSLPAELREASKPRTPSGTSRPPQRTIHFGNGYSLGRLQIRDWDSPTWEWQDLGPAKGDVKVPAAKEAYLLLDPSAAQDLSILSELGPDDLQSMSMAATPVTDKQLEHLSGLTGLRTLDLRRAPITDESAGVLKKLVSLRGVTLPPQLSRETVASLKDALPNTNIQLDDADAVSPAAFGGTPSGARTVTFPSKNMGLLMTRSWDLPIWNWQELGPAQGTVQVPPNQELLLVVYPEWKDDLSPLSDLGKDDLQSLHLRPAPIGDDQLAHVAHLTGLRTLDLRDTKITDAGLDRIAELIDARRIWLPNQISEQSRQELANALPKCKIA